MAHPAARVSHVTGAPWDNVNVEMRNGLASCRSLVETNIEPVWAVALDEKFTPLLDRICQRRLFRTVKVCPSGDVPMGR
jgi:hypothetical protein